MTGRWFRMYDEVVNDPKVQRLPAKLFKFWVNLLCISAQNRGRIPAETALVFTLRLRKKEVADGLRKLIEAELIDKDDNGLSPHNWKIRQFDSDFSADRMRRHRDGRQTVTVTPPDTEQNRSDQNARARVREDEDFFKRFWAVYPRREGGSNEEAAREAFQRAVEDGAEPLIIIGGASGYAEQQREQGNIDTRFVAMAARWLDDKRWTETPPKVPMRSVAEIAEDMAARGWRWSSENERWERMS